jgi:hypothetical protein
VYNEKSSHGEQRKSTLVDLPKETTDSLVGMFVSKGSRILVGDRGMGSGKKAEQVCERNQESESEAAAKKRVRNRRR